MAGTKLSFEQYKAERDAGMSDFDISLKYDVHIRNVQHRARVYNGKLTPVAPACPDGFVINQVSTTVDAEGEVKSQSMRAVPEPLDEPIDLVPAGMFMKGLSTFTDGQGNVRGQWTISRRDAEQQKLAIQTAIETLAEGIPPAPVIHQLKIRAAEDLLNLYTLTDCHVGMLAWARETGEAWDLSIAEKVLVDAFAQMIDAAPDADVGIVNQLGDFLHFDGLSAITPTSGHILDADSRFQKMVEVAVRILETVIVLALKKHPRVVVYMHEGNHDMASSVWLRVLFARVFRENPRVYVEQSPNPYVAYHHGQTMLGFHHGHLAKKERLPLIFAAKFNEMWGHTKHREIHTGHLHNEEVKEYPGIKTRQHPTLSAKDAYAARFGYDSLRQATCWTYHKAKGNVGSLNFSPDY